MFCRHRAKGDLFRFYPPLAPCAVLRRAGDRTCVDRAELGRTLWSSPRGGNLSGRPRRRRLAVPSLWVYAGEWGLRLLLCNARLFRAQKVSLNVCAFIFFNFGLIKKNQKRPNEPTREVALQENYLVYSIQRAFVNSCSCGLF